MSEPIVLSSALRRLRGPLGGLLALIIGLVLLNTSWVWRFRIGFPLDIDEAGYLAIAVADTLGWLSSGVLGLWHEFQTHTPAAPLLMLVTVPAQLLLANDILAGFAVAQLFLAALLLSSYALGSRLANPAAGLLAAFIVGTAPGVTDYARMYHFAVPSAALFVAATYALIRSEGLQRGSWAVLWGVLLGLCVLTRTMMLGLVPAFVLVAAWQVWSRGEARKQRARHLLAGLVVAAATAAIWYARNWQAVLSYLLDSGYGARSEIIGVATTPGSLEFWLARVDGIIRQGTYLPLAFLLLTCMALALAVWSCRALRGRGFRAAVTAVLRSDAGQVIMILAASYLALTSTRNVGTGFILPLVPLLAGLAAASLFSMPWRWVRRSLLAGFILVGCLNLTMNAGVSTALSAPRRMRVPVLGHLPVLDGRGNIKRYLARAGHDVGTAAAPLPDVHTEWPRVDRQVATFLADFAAARGKRPAALFASKDPVFNSNSVRLAGNLHVGRTFHVGELRSRQGDRVDAYHALLKDPALRPNFLITTPPGPGEFRPRVTQSFAEAAAKRLGFDLKKTFRLPDGRTTRIWWAPRGWRPAATELVRVGALEAAAISLDAGPPGQGRTRRFTGSLADSSGSGIGNGRVQLTARALAGPGVWGEYRLTGVVPTRATRALVGIRVNTECECAGPSEIAVSEVRYSEPPSAGNLVPNPNFAAGLQGWDPPGTLALHLDSLDRRGPPVIQVRVPATESALINSTPFPVHAESAFDFRVIARVSPTSGGTGYFAIIFLDDQEVLRETIPVAPAPASKGSTTTTEAGTFQAVLRDLPPGRLLIEATYSGDATYWPARARRIVEVEGRGGGG